MMNLTYSTNFGYFISFHLGHMTVPFQIFREQNLMPPHQMSEQLFGKSKCSMQTNLIFPHLQND